MKAKNLFYSLLVPALFIGCAEPEKGCTDRFATNFEASAVEDDGSCLYLTEIRGCTNPLSENYNPDATIDDGSCIILGCMDPKAPNYNPLANVDDGSCIDIREDFYGTWEVTNDCGFTFALSGQLEILPDSIESDVILFRYLSAAETSDNYAIVSDFDIEFPDQDLDGGFLATAFTADGEINTEGTEITIDFEYEGFFGPQTCSATLTKL
jgi:hypothetical protein